MALTEEVRAKLSELVEASPVDLSALPEDRQRLAKRLAKTFKGKVVEVMDGIHGYVAVIDLPTGSPLGPRFKRDQIKKLTDKTIRWVEFRKDHISVGM